MEGIQRCADWVHDFDGIGCARSKTLTRMHTFKREGAIGALGLVLTICRVGFGIKANFFRSLKFVVF